MENGLQKQKIFMEESTKNVMRRKVLLTFEISDHIDKWDDILESLKSFIVIEGRMLNKRAADDEDRHLGNWLKITKNKKEEPTANVNS